MNVKEKISSFQMAIIMYQTLLGTAILLMPSITTLLAGRDMWLTPILGSTAGFITVWATYRLHQLFPNQIIYTYMDAIIGKIPSKVVGFIFLLFNLHIIGATTRDYAEFIVGNFFDKTPLLVIIASMIIVCAFAVQGGIEVIARCIQLFLPVVILFLLLNILFIIPEMKPSNVLPVLEKGWIPPLQGTLVIQGWFCQFMLVSFLYPSIKDKDKTLKWAQISIVATSVTMTLTNLATLFLLGLLAGRFNYPILFASRYIMLADFFEHVEAMVMMAWVLGAFSKISFLYYTLAVGAAEWLKLDHYRPLIVPIGLLAILMSVWVSTNLQELSRFISTTGTIYILTWYMGLPVLLLAIASIRRVGSR
ncbi:GerAB/ArcD/ProY family transporter [Paenibacillus agricola]|uniref:Endospore germination permease n=1 Tax=Paenibacillus agricola TaxID=2716264 RepID=A0ABX0J301_9BACL|nr:endospore germination permease [Paenibacillus agricola]NHN29203.1 endospore germination permease [Paenibacillus agricola]